MTRNLFAIIVVSYRRVSLPYKSSKKLVFMDLLQAVNGNKKEMYELQLIYIFYSMRNLCSVTIKQIEAMWIRGDC